MNPVSPFRRFILVTALALAALGAALAGGAAAGAQQPRPNSPPLTLPPAGPGAAPAAKLTLERFEVIEVGGTGATLVVRASAPTILSYTLRRLSPPEPQTAALPTPTYIAEHRFRLPNLQSNAIYDLTIYATSADGQNAVANKQFTTAKKRIRMVLESIDVKDDGDGIFTGDGEPVWTMHLAWSSPARAVPAHGYCYPTDCKHRDVGEGRFTPRNAENKALMLVWAEEHFDHFPDTISLGVSVTETDNGRITDDWAIRLWDCIFSALDGGCPSGEETPTPWRVPQGVESATQYLTVNGDDTVSGFESVLTFRMELVHVHAPPPPAARNQPHSTWR